MHRQKKKERKRLDSRSGEKILQRRISASLNKAAVGGSGRGRCGTGKKRPSWLAATSASNQLTGKLFDQAKDWIIHYINVVASKKKKKKKKKAQKVCASLLRPPRPVGLLNLQASLVHPWDSIIDPTSRCIAPIQQQSELSENIVGFQ